MSQIIETTCPSTVTRKNSSCLLITYNSLAEANDAVIFNEVATITNSTGGSADGVYNAIGICDQALFTVNFSLGSASCNCNGNYMVM